jgi:hypothetical protein
MAVLAEETDTQRDPAISLGVIKTAFDLGWKLLPVLWVIFQFYANQNTISEKSESNKKNIERLETSLNKLDRKVVEVQATANSLKEQMANDRQFYLATQVPGRR